MQLNGGWRCFIEQEEEEEECEGGGWEVSGGVGGGMAGPWSRGREEYEPCGIGLTSHSLPSAAQDM